MMDFSNPLLALGALVLLGLGLVVLVILATILRQVFAANFGWGAWDWRTVLASFVILVGAIHFGNYALSLLDGAETPPAGFPPAFLIGAVAIGVGIAAIRGRGR